MMSWMIRMERRGARRGYRIGRWRKQDDTFNCLLPQRSGNLSDFCTKTIKNSPTLQSGSQTRDHGNHGICISSSSTPRLPRREGRRRASREKEKKPAIWIPHAPHHIPHTPGAEAIGQADRPCRTSFFPLGPLGNPKATSAPFNTLHSPRDAVTAKTADGTGHRGIVGLLLAAARGGAPRALAWRDEGLWV